ncbi:MULTISPECIES: DUF742 domain-containing protein [Actinomadura]|uniref:DUF742 domain-containing protein n=1 Tax=Actinomadura yumaensis TaxID=111807 RepID=A0ABW2CJ63_9ACTN|nr:DUF742 domain-containing protein [Actinomadura sp. J1-007]MWK37941.1 DUF742 domain-containing protein [Actinomadura sp. J1-007]
MDRGSPYGSGPGGRGRWPGDPQVRPPAQGQPGQGQPGAAPGQGRPPGGPPPGEGSDTSSLVRPYAVTGGRTKPRYDLAIEALVTAAPYPPRDVAMLTPEYRAIMDLCRSARSVAEVSALLRLPLGVARVLVADMALEGLLRLHQSRPAGAQPDLRLLERVLSGLRKL